MSNTAPSTGFQIETNNSCLRIDSTWRQSNLSRSVKFHWTKLLLTHTQIHIENSKLELLRRKLELARLPANSGSGEENGVTADFMQETVQFWLTKYDWRAEEAKLNVMPQFTTSIDVDVFGELDIHFVHSKTFTQDTMIPLLFLHGWPGSFLEVSKMLPLLNQAGFDVVAPSLPGYGFSSYPAKAGFKHKHHAKAFHSLMLRLGYEAYAVQGGDWGSDIARTMAVMVPTHIKALHQNMVSSRVVHRVSCLIRLTAHDGKARLRRRRANIFRVRENMSGTLLLVPRQQLRL